MNLLRLVAETLLYYLACSLLARTKEDSPGIIRVFITVLIVAFISSAGTAVIDDIWLNNVVVAIISFIILWIGLGIGFIRTLVAAVIVMILRSLMEAAFSNVNVPDFLNWTSNLN